MPKVLRVELTTSECNALEKMRLTRKSNVGERAYYILLLQAGNKIGEIAQQVGRHPHTIRYWVKQYITIGLSGLMNQLPPGRPDKKTCYVAEHLDVLLSHCPRDYGYQQSGWQVNLLVDYFAHEGETISPGTVSRALKQQGWVYKRFAKGVPRQSLSREKKLEKVQALISSVEEEKLQTTVEIFFEDECHVNNEPYVERGWFKRGEKK